MIHCRILCLGLALERTEKGQQHGHIILDNAPQRIVVDAEIAVNQLVTGGDNHAPGDLRIGCPKVIRNMGCGFADRLQIAKGCIVNDSARQEISLVRAMGLQ